MNRKHLGIVAETALRRILVSKGYQASRNAASHGLFDVLAFGNQSVLVIEVKSTAGAKLYLTKTSGQIEKLMLLSATCKRAGDNVLGVVAVYWGMRDAFELYAVDECLEDPVLKYGGGLDVRDIDDGTCSATPPKNSSPYSPPSQD
jgi:Holliday junction resolvase